METKVANRDKGKDKVIETEGKRQRDRDRGTETEGQRQMGRDRKTKIERERLRRREGGKRQRETFFLSFICLLSFHKL